MDLFAIPGIQHNYNKVMNTFEEFELIFDVLNLPYRTISINYYLSNH